MPSPGRAWLPPSRPYVPSCRSAHPPLPLRPYQTLAARTWRTCARRRRARAARPARPSRCGTCRCTRARWMAPHSYCRRPAARPRPRASTAASPATAGRTRPRRGRVRARALHAPSLRSSAMCAMLRLAMRSGSPHRLQCVQSDMRNCAVGVCKPERQRGSAACAGGAHAGPSARTPA